MLSHKSHSEISDDKGLQLVFGQGLDLDRPSQSPDGVWEMMECYLMAARSHTQEQLRGNCAEAPLGLLRSPC